MATEPSRRRSNVLVFGLSSLLLVMLLCCVVFAVWRASRQRHQAECILRVQRQSGVGTVDDIQEYMTFKETQAALLKSFLVLKAAAKNPKVAAILAHESDPVSGSVKRAHLEQAIANIEEHFDVVGVVDRLDDGLVCLSRMYNWEFEGIGRLNTGVNKTELIERDVALRRLVEDQNRYDIELYDYCRRRFDEQATQLL